MTFRRSLLLAALLTLEHTALACAAPRAAVAPAHASIRTQILPLADVHAGQKAVVRTVFTGSTIEPFDAEIVGVLHNGRAEGDVILARATSDRVVQTGIAQGMSGSPVYVDGKLIGALSSGWEFSKEPIFGVTPIEEMLQVLDQPMEEPGGTSAGPSGADLTRMNAGGAPGGLGNDAFGPYRWDADPAPLAGSVPAGLALSAPGGAPMTTPPPSAAPPLTPSAVPGADGPRPLGLPLSCVGLSGTALDVARQWLAPLGLSAVPGGAAAHGGPDAASLEPGSAVAVDLLRGDLQFSAIGTATWVEGSRVLAFGHPFFQSGYVRLPLATAEIATILPSTSMSFKIGMRGRTVGAIQQDRRAAIAGEIGASPQMLPFSVAVRGVRPTAQTFRFETIEDRNLAPVLIAIATLNSFMESGGGGANQTLRWHLTLHRPGAAPLALSDVTTGDAPPTDLANAILAPVRFLYGNPYGALALDSLAVAVEVLPGRGQWTLRNARVLGGAVRPGARVRVSCELERWRGGRDTRVVTLEVPEELPQGRYGLWVGGGAELMRFEAARLPGLYRPVSLQDAWVRLAQTRPTDSLYAVLFASAPEVTTGGLDYPELPASALPLLTNETSSGDLSRRGSLARFGEQRIPFQGQVRGEILLPVQVDPDAP